MPAADRGVSVILDVDTGIDDAIALLVALGDARATLRAVTCVRGGVALDAVVANTMGVLACASASEVPVIPGARASLASNMVLDGRLAHGDDGLGGAGFDPSAHESPGGFAPDALVELVSSDPGRHLLVCTAPLTNLALALHREPDLLKKLASLVVMGGAYAVPGNVSPTAEFNFRADPEAAATVFRAARESERPLIAVGLDVTTRFVLEGAALEQLTSPGADAGALKRRMGRALKSYAEFYRRHLGLAGCQLHDALAVVLAIHPELYRCSEVSADIERFGERTIGQAVVDWTASGSDVNVAVVQDFDVQATFSVLDNALNSIMSGR